MTVWGPQETVILGRYVSVALSFELPRQDVILHPALVKPGLSSPGTFPEAAVQRTPRSTVYTEKRPDGGLNKQKDGRFTQAVCHKKYSG